MKMLWPSAPYPSSPIPSSSSPTPSSPSPEFSPLPRPVSSSSSYFSSSSLPPLISPSPTSPSPTSPSPAFPSPTALSQAFPFPISPSPTSPAPTSPAPISPALTSPAPAPAPAPPSVIPNPEGKRKKKLNPKRKGFGMWTRLPNTGFATTKTADGTSIFYNGRVSTPTGTALVFISLTMLPLLRTSEEIACDGTFATVPLLLSQLFTLHVAAYRYMFPLAYAVMSEKTQSLYQLGLDRILHAIFRKVCTEELRQSYMHRPNVKKIVKMLIALALLPAAQAHQGFYDICQSSVVLLQDETRCAKMQIIYEYMGSYWFQIVTPDRLSVNGQPRRTTNEVESFHRWFNRRCGKYHQILAKSRRRCVKDYNLARSGRLIRREHAKKQTEKDARIRTFCQSFDNREITVYQFLEMCSRFFEPLHNPAPLGGLLADPFDSYHKNSVSDKSLEEDQQGADVGPDVNRRVARVRRHRGVRRGDGIRGGDGV
ncbi:uncharacterized protein LOC123475559 [Daphnia magna]|uniref:uncharacterized protein LOC123475559 n=1 Tax=Daphnia magna TaxID=35525 RepID=UPI001E1BD32D|nr:uncharacterized protein LOC123475559 [Daphnia magna]